MVDVLTFVKGNTKEDFNFQVDDAKTNTGIDLTSATLVFRCFKRDFTTLVFSGTAIADADQVTNNGKATYTTVSGDMDTTGSFLGELEILFTDGRYLRLHNSVINIVAAAPTA